MVFTLSTIPEHGIVTVRVKGILNEDIRKDILARSVSQCRASGYHRILIDVAQSIMPPVQPMAEALTIISFMHRLGITPQIKFAIIYRTDEEIRKFFEIMARQEKFQVRYFLVRQKAISWLCK